VEYERLAYDIALRSLERQERGLEELRARTGVLLGAASLAVSFLGAEAFGDSPPAVLTILALASFIVAVGASVYILLPSRSLSFGHGGRATFERLYHYREDMGEVYRRRIRELDSLWKENARVLDAVAEAYRVAAAALTVEVFVLVTLTSGRVF
jgi:hypothetical protein